MIYILIILLVRWKWNIFKIWISEKSSNFTSNLTKIELILIHYIRTRKTSQRLLNVSEKK